MFILVIQISFTSQKQQRTWQSEQKVQRWKRERNFKMKHFQLRYADKTRHGVISLVIRFIHIIPDKVKKKSLSQVTIIIKSKLCQSVRIFRTFNSYRQKTPQKSFAEIFHPSLSCPLFVCTWKLHVCVSCCFKFEISRKSAHRLIKMHVIFLTVHYYLNNTMSSIIYRNVKFDI